MSSTANKPKQKKAGGWVQTVNGSWRTRMKQVLLHWSKKLATKKGTRARRSMKSATAQRKRTGRSQAGPDGSWEMHLPQKTKKPMPSAWSKWELLAIMGSVFLLLCILLCYDNFHFHVAHMYAHLGYPDAQHIVGQRYLKGAGVEKNEDKAMEWFRQAAETGHPHASFNLAVGKLKNMTAVLEEGEVEKLLSIAAGYGLKEAQNLLENIRKRNGP